ncbi:hypothetical protein [Yoonia sp.]|uniref:hypothetical protein n=1 Tax=Yoonia sp. TaxID=2212373 RepID=UPI003F6C39E5
MTDWYLILMVWGDKYGAADCNRLIRDAYAHSNSINGVIVLTDRMDRTLDPRATLCPIAPDFDREDYKSGGLPVKISMFEIDALPTGAACVYVDLDSAIIGDLGALAALTQTAPIWTLGTFRARFNLWARLKWRLSKGNIFGAGNSSAFAFCNKFAGNPTAKFRENAPIHGRHNPHARLNDDRFIGWSCQDIIRPIPTNLAVRFRMEFLSPTVLLNRIKAWARRNHRQDLALVTFDGDKTKPEIVRALREGDLIVDHHGRQGRWCDAEMSGLRARLKAGLQD